MERECIGIALACSVSNAAESLTDALGGVELQRRLLINHNQRSKAVRIQTFASAKALIVEHLFDYFARHR